MTERLPLPYGSRINRDARVSARFDGRELPALEGDTVASALVASDTEGSSEEDQEEPEEDTRVLKMLYKGNMEEVNKRVEQERRARVISHKHAFYKQTRCTSAAQEEQSALPAGVLNVHEDSSDEEDYF